MYDDVDCCSTVCVLCVTPKTCIQRVRSPPATRPKAPITDCDSSCVFLQKYNPGPGARVSDEIQIDTLRLCGPRGRACPAVHRGGMSRGRADPRARTRLASLSPTPWPSRATCLGPARGT